MERYELQRHGQPRKQAYMVTLQDPTEVIRVQATCPDTAVIVAQGIRIDRETITLMSGKVIRCKDIGDDEAITLHTSSTENHSLKSTKAELTDLWFNGKRSNR